MLSFLTIQNKPLMYVYAGNG